MKIEVRDPVTQPSGTIETYAESFVGPYPDGQDFEWVDRLRLDDNIHRRRIGDHINVYTFKDGSRIIENGAAWDYGVHETRLVDP